MLRFFNFKTLFQIIMLSWWLCPVQTLVLSTIMRDVLNKLIRKQNKFESPFEVSAQYISFYWNIARSKKHWTMWVHSVRTMWAHRTRIRMLGQAHLGLFNQVSWPLVSAPLPFDTNGSVWLIWIIVSTALDVPANEICGIICLSCSGLRDKLMWTFRRRGRPITIKLHEKQFDLHWL